MKLAQKLLSMYEKVDGNARDSVRAVSSGTFATLTGIKNNDDIDFIRSAYIDFSLDAKDKFNHWGDAWIAFAKHHGLKTDKKDSSVDGKKLISSIELKG
jgi:hypothetical protein